MKTAVKKWKEYLERQENGTGEVSATDLLYYGYPAANAPDVGRFGQSSEDWMPF